ncbi:uncharacterized protein F5Z01DRAFT_647165 [Emericellopsis atlantica]|uniref:Cytoskeleton-associated protein n=1 Tax=Emericellopsis atlantica TaxID=2614577 RepID=A0A9P7ZSC4_9HYPO|nr:uncharacterized protein F5Z01DRAFT_647165 [Emericellopsis atlantica]KAG9256957.1 hypothetical protein F5Z01DRAFT_647165 [Emericellopsis atlantica]
MGWLTSLQAFGRDERVILVTIGMATACVVSSMFTALVIMRDDTALPPVQPKSRYITQDTEDSLEIDTLEKLLNHPSYSIGDIATKILCDRAVNNPDAINTLLFGITQPDYDERLRSLRALALLTGYDGLPTLHRPATYFALVKSLQHSLNDVEPPKLDDSRWDEYLLRDIAERFCLMLILELINDNGAGTLIKAKFVEKWLSKQDWGESPSERRQNFAAYMDFKSNRIVTIVGHIQRSKKGLKALEKAGLIEEVAAKRQIQELPDAVMKTLPVIDLRESIEPADPQVARPMEQSVEEQRIRRQHREAMVLNDGSRPFGRGDIFERDHATPD